MLYRLCYRIFKHLRRMWQQRGYYYELGNGAKFLPDQNLGYIPISKVANSSIKLALLKTTVPEGEDPYTYPHLAFNQVSKMNISDRGGDNGFVFTLVRNPLERLVSCYKDKIVQAKEKGKPSPFEWYLEGYLMRADDFSDFVKRISWIPEQLQDSHFASQYNIIYKRRIGGKAVASRVPDFIGRFERLNEDWQLIKERFDVADIPHHNATPKDDWRDYYDLQTAKRVYRFYQKDIHAFGYEEDYRQLVAYLLEKESMTDD